MAKRHPMFAGAHDTWFADWRPDRFRQARIRFGHDVRPIAAANLASATWLLGEAENARRFAELAVRTAAELGHAQTSTNAHTYLAFLRPDSMTLTLRFVWRRRYFLTAESTRWTSGSRSEKFLPLGRVVGVTIRRRGLQRCGGRRLTISIKATSCWRPSCAECSLTSRPRPMASTPP